MNMVEDKNPKDSTGETHLHSAAENGHLDMCNLILKNTKEIGTRDGNGWTPLHYSAQNNHILVHEAIMKMSKDKNPENSEGFTPLHLAAADGEGGFSMRLACLMACLLLHTAYHAHGYLLCVSPTPVVASTVFTASWYIRLRRPSW